MYFNSVMKEILANALPYLGVEEDLNTEEQKIKETQDIEVGSYVGMKVTEAKNEIIKSDLTCEIVGEGDTVANQFPLSGEMINYKSKVILYTN